MSTVLVPVLHAVPVSDIAAFLVAGGDLSSMLAGLPTALPQNYIAAGVTKVSWVCVGMFGLDGSPPNLSLVFELRPFA